jgi:hypothetical protein
MRYFISIIFITKLSITFSQKNFAGLYEDHFYSSIQFNTDSTFKYKWSFDLSSSWSNGVWSIKKNKIYLTIVPIYDTINIETEFGKKDSLILSRNEISERKKATLLDFISTYGQSIKKVPDVLKLKRGKLFLFKKGKLDKSKIRRNWSSEFFRTYYLKKENS